MKALALVLVLLASSAQAQYVPPAGIPVPSFGVNEARPTPTLYVNAATGNDGNPGTLGSPKATIPRNLAAGTYVQVTGTQTLDYSEANRIHSAGTSGSPVWIMSDPGGAAMAFTHLVEIDGTYLIMDGGTGLGVTARDTAAGGDTNHIAFRNGNHTGASFAYSAAGGVVSEIVFKAMVLHETGNLYAGEAGGDQHCIKINAADHVYVLGTLFYKCNGDGVQVGDVAAPAGLLTNHIYLGGNICLGNRQTCLWSKQSVGVVMSQNVAAYMRSIPEPSPPAAPNTYLNPAACFGAQYGAKAIVIMQNICTLSDWGIRLAAWLLPDGNGVTIAGNYIYTIHSSIGNGGQPDYGGSGGHAIQVADQGNQSVLVTNNTIYDVDAGIGSVPAEGTMTYLNNIFMFTGHHDIVDNTSHPIVTYNNFDNAAIIHGDALANNNAVIGDPLFVNAAGRVFDLQALSPALHAGFAFDINPGYLALHGVSTGLDYSTTPNMGASQVDPNAVVGAHPVFRRRFR